ncbi:hypothetical protein [Streptomyces sp. NPDC047028]|uniref:hypothetical protein n=1 Tax=Streptomyces sp. NPDC047028 TaxID=3155793 RepID=UPI0033F94CAA
MLDYRVSEGPAQLSDAMLDYYQHKIMSNEHWPVLSGGPSEAVLSCPNGFVCFELTPSMFEDPVQCCIALFHASGDMLAGMSYTDPIVVPFGQDDDAARSVLIDLANARECRFEVWLSEIDRPMEAPGSAEMILSVYV